MALIFCCDDREELPVNIINEIWMHGGTWLSVD
jgi:hypothetical protein